MSADPPGSSGGDFISSAEFVGSSRNGNSMSAAPQVELAARNIPGPTCRAQPYGFSVSGTTRLVKPGGCTLTGATWLAQRYGPNIASAA